MTTNSTGVASDAIVINAGTSAAEIERVINSAPAGATISLAAGTYTFTSTVEVTRSDVTIIGAGQGETIITLAASLKGAPAFQIGSPLFGETYTATTTVAAGIAAGSNTITLAAGSVSVGDTLWITAANTAELFAEIGDTKWQKDKPLRTALVTVEAVNGQTVTLSDGVDFDMPANLTTVRTLSIVTDVTLSGMTFKGAYGVANPGNFTNTIAAEDDGMVVLVNATNNVHVTDLEILNMGSNGIVLGASIAPVVDDIYISGAHNKGDAGNGYGIWIRDVYNGTFDNLTIYDTRHAVLFASYTSASGNAIHVLETNRDINFHGGLDTDNTVIVDNSIRDTTAEQNYMGTVVFFNQGETYGAPTDADANTVLFTNVIGTVRADAVHATDLGATIYTLGSTDEVWGGAGNDYIDLGSGTDRAHASAGYDIIVGGSGVDTLVFDHHRRSGLIYEDAGRTVILDHGNVTVLDGVEYIAYDDATVEVATLRTNPVTRLAGTASYDRLFTSSDAILDATVEAATVTGLNNTDIMANDLNNNIMGNDADNQLYLRGGDDRSGAGRGDDYVDGGSGNDYIVGGAGNDVVIGGDGVDTLFGQHGADTFVASGGTNVVRDFNYRQGDLLAFGDMDMPEVLTALLSAYREGNDCGSGITYTNTSAGLLLTDSEANSLSLAGLTALKSLDQYDMV